MQRKADNYRPFSGLFEQRLAFFCPADGISMRKTISRARHPIKTECEISRYHLPYKRKTRLKDKLRFDDLGRTAKKRQPFGKVYYNEVHRSVGLPSALQR